LVEAEGWHVESFLLDIGLMKPICERADALRAEWREKWMAREVLKRRGVSDDNPEFGELSDWIWTRTKLIREEPNCLKGEPSDEEYYRNPPVEKMHDHA
jgi:hypothetical protein